MFIHAYLRASHSSQNALRAREVLQGFVEGHGQRIASYYIENASGATLERPELMRLLEDAKSGDIILVEQTDRISRLCKKDWDTLKGMIQSKGLRIVSLDLPTSHLVFQPQQHEFMNSMLDAINSMLLDMLACIAFKDNADRARRRDEGIAIAKSQGKYRGRPANEERKANIKKLHSTKQHSLREIAKILNCSLSTVQRSIKVK